MIPQLIAKKRQELEGQLGPLLVLQTERQFQMTELAKEITRLQTNLADLDAESEELPAVARAELTKLVFPDA